MFGKLYRILCKRIQVQYLLAFNLVWVISQLNISNIFFRIMSRTTTTVTATRTAQPAAKQEDFSQYVKKGISQETVIRLKECFDIFDADQSGEVTTLELKNAIVALGIEKEALKVLQIVQEYTETESIDFPTFLQVFGFAAEEPSEASSQELFAEFTGGKQTFTVDQFHEICERIGEHFTRQEIEAMIQAADANQDGVIDYEEFLSVVTKEYKK